MLPLPDLLYRHQHATLDETLLEELLEIAFLGTESSDRLDAALESVEPPAGSWNPEHFADELFLESFVDGCLSLEVGGVGFAIHERLVRRVLERPPDDLETVRFRQGILRELASDPAIRRETEALYRDLYSLLTLFKAASAGQQVDYTSFRLDILSQVKRTIDRMAEGFSGSASGLRRLRESGEELRATSEYELLAAVLDFEGRLSDLELAVRLGADGRIRRLQVRRLTENKTNRFYRGPLARWLDPLRMVWFGYRLDRKEMADRVVVSVYLEIAPALRTLLQVLGHLEIYLAMLSFAELAERRGLAVSLPRIAPGARLELTELFNPLLLRGGGRPVPCDIATAGGEATVVVTGPNSGGKTRMLQAVGLAQLLGQSGFFVPARRATMPWVESLFTSLHAEADADAEEGRLGAELLRIRTLFTDIEPGSMVLLDELCSGTNPSEAAEIVAMVLELLPRIRPLAFITTHFLDFVQGLRERSGSGLPAASGGLELLQVEVGANGAPTYRFVPGVAASSLAGRTAERLGVTFEELGRRLDERLEGGGARKGRVIPLSGRGAR